MYTGAHTLPFSSISRFWKRATLVSTRTLIADINAREDAMMALSDDELASTTQRLRAAFEGGKTLDDLLPEAFAAVREAGRRHLGMRAYDVQLFAGIQIHRGRVAEMKTGEGKTLMSAFPAYLNALSAKGVHVITVNEYLAERDCATMGRLFTALGATTGLVTSTQHHQEKKAAYACDITYGTNHEIGFDFLRDGLKSSVPEMAQRGLSFAIIDEIDSILIDEARTPSSSPGLARRRARCAPRWPASSRSPSQSIGSWTKKPLSHLDGSRRRVFGGTRPPARSAGQRHRALRS